MLCPRRRLLSISCADLPHLQGQPEQETPVPGQDRGAEVRTQAALLWQLNHQQGTWVGIMKPRQGDAVG